MNKTLRAKRIIKYAQSIYKEMDGTLTLDESIEQIIYDLREFVKEDSRLDWEKILKNSEDCFDGFGE